MNQADAGASWSMLGKLRALSTILERGLCTTDVDLGLAIRLAQSIGLYFPSDPDGMKDSVEKDKATTEHYIW